jgi:mono/diheme cytochrome c family protein
MRVVEMNKYILGILFVSGLVLTGKIVTVDAAMTETKASMSASDRGDTGEGAYMGYCLSCHGMEGKGDGPLSEAIGDVLPRDLSDAEYMSTRSDEELFNVIKNGGKKTGFSDTMPDWGYNFPDADIRGIVEYIRSDLCKCKYEGGKGD